MRKKRAIKKPMVLILTLAMLLTLFPASAFASTTMTVNRVVTVAKGDHIPMIVLYLRANNDFTMQEQTFILTLTNAKWASEDRDSLLAPPAAKGDASALTGTPWDPAGPSIEIATETKAERVSLVSAGERRAEIHIKTDGFIRHDEAIELRLALIAGDEKGSVGVQIDGLDSEISSTGTAGGSVSSSDSSSSTSLSSSSSGTDSETELITPGAVTTPGAASASEGAEAATSGAASAPAIAADITPVTPAMPVNPFADVSGSSWYIDHVIYVNDKGLMSGTNAEPALFSPDAHVTRAMAVTALWNMARENSSSASLSAAGGGRFSDVAEGDYYYQAVNWAAENGIAAGMGDGRFAPKESITREQTAVMLMNYLQHTGLDIVVTEQYILFPDEKDIEPYAKNAMQLLNKLKIVNGSGDNAIQPKKNTTRAEFASMLHSFMELMQEYGQ